MSDHNDWSHWRGALAGKKIDTEPGNPRTGYYRSQTGEEVFAIWRDADDIVRCRRSKFGDGSKMSPDEIDEQFGWISVYPITYELFTHVINGGVLPPEYKTRLTTKEIAAGVVWTPEIGKKKLALNPEIFDEKGNPRPAPGDNNPPEDLPPDQALIKRIYGLGVQLGEWLKGIGGAPRDQAEAEILSGYANKFKDFENEATAAHKAEKDPHWQKCKDIDAKWFGPVRDRASAYRDKAIGMIRTWEKAEDDKRIEAARVANENAAKAAESLTSKLDDSAPPPPAAFVPEPAKVSTLRGSGKKATEKLITDLPAFVVHCASMNPPHADLVETAEKIARAFKKAGVVAPGMVATDKKEVA